MENSINRNKVVHTHEVVYSLVHWLDDEVFEQCPTWETCITAGKIPRSDLERYFGEAIETKEGLIGGPGHYAQCVKYGVGRRVLAKALEGSESEDNIEEALRELPPTARRKRGIELEIQEAIAAPAHRPYKQPNSCTTVLQSTRLMYNFRGSKSCTRCGTRPKVA